MSGLAAVGGDVVPSGEATIQVVELFVALIAAAAVVALLTRRSGLPYTVALVLQVPGRDSGGRP